VNRKHVLVLVSALLSMSFSGCKDKGGGKEPSNNNPVNRPGGASNGNEGLAEKELREALAPLRELEDKVDRARAGETVDFSGSGSSFRMWTDESGVHYTEGYGPPHNPSRYTTERRPDGTFKGRHSSMDDGIIDRQEERGNGKTVSLYDTDRDGIFDRRVTRTLSDDPKFVRFIEEKRTSECPKDKECWEVVQNRLEPTIMRTYQLPPKPETTSQLSGPPGFFFENSAQVRMGSADATQASLQMYDTTPRLNYGLRIITSGDGSCTPNSGEIPTIAATLAGVHLGGLRCLAATNLAMEREFEAALAGNHHVDIYCGFEGEHELMNKPLEERPLGFAEFHTARDASGKWLTVCNETSPCVIKINRDYLNARGIHQNVKPNDIQKTVLHELLHTLGFGNNDDVKHNEGTDETHACGRYCGGCSQSGLGFQHSSIDCARCADSSERKRRCGTKTVYGLGTPNSFNICGCTEHSIGGFCLGYMPCTQSTYREQMFFCDGTFFYESPFFSCCYGPCVGASLEWENYVAMCQRQVANWEEVKSRPIFDSCNQPPPFCQ